MRVPMEELILELQKNNLLFSYQNIAQLLVMKDNAISTQIKILQREKKLSMT